jgi:quinol monooxygenase YgiN
MMWVRVVSLIAKAGEEEELRQMGRGRLVPINREAGCYQVYFLEPNDPGSKAFGVVSIWEKEETLQAMKNSSIYYALCTDLEPLLESQSDTLYYTHS